MSLLNAFASPSSRPLPLAVPGDGGDSAPLFRKLDWAAFWVVFLATLAVYTFTLAPTVTLEDSGELAVASDFLGVPHPPGYPIWTLLTWFFQWIFHFVTYHGHPNPAWGVAFCSTVSGAAACGVLALLVCRSASALLAPAVSNAGVSRTACFASAVSAGLLLAFSPVLWSQSVIVEVYALNALFQMGVLLLVYLWMTHPKRDSLLLSAAFFFGLGLTNHQTLLFLGLALAVAVMMKDPDLFRDFAIPAVILGAVFILAAKGVQLFVGGAAMDKWARLGADGRLWKWSLGPDNEFFWAYNYAFLSVPMALAIGTATRGWPASKRFAAGAAGAVGLYALVCLLAAYFHSAEATGFSSLLFPGFMPSAKELAGESMFVRWLFSATGPGGKAVCCWVLCLLLPFGVMWLKLPHGKTVASAILLAEIGVAFYLYLPLASEQNPPMNWGYPRTWGGFMHAVTRGQYDAITPTDVFSEKFIQQLGAYLTDLRSQFSLPIALVGFLPFCAWGFSLPRGGRRLHALPAALAVFAFATLFIVLESLGWTGAAKLYRPAAGLLILSAVFGMSAMLSTWLVDLFRSFKSLAVSTRVFVAGFFAVLALALCWMAFHCLKAAFADGVPALVKHFFLVAGLGPWVAIAATVALALSPLKLASDLSEGTQKWLLTSIIGFISVSVIFLIFQNPSLDLQSLFIGRVQFIQSHAFYAIWIGYGAAMAINALGASAGRPARFAAALAVLALPAVLLWQNAYDETQLRQVGGAEQNGHTFGWQFGNWELEGVKGIKEDFGYWYPEEEDFAREWGAFTNAMGKAEPDFPPPMGQGAVFFGGTDPGRFVPTYMIYSAEVRSDVYLITQNALADNTFMNVTRDLYGDTIYIPSAADSDQAFKQYVDDVSSGKVAAGADISVENGRVSVQGVQGVMTINGLLARLIFEGNKAEHEFYVEESYAIQWMYPYLTPNGLIMKINAEPLARLPADVVDNDHRFWGWYTDWLLSKSEFTRDICARKSFSKLRSAIAGLYEYRRNWAEAEYAYKQAVALYPLSPEAVLRLAQMYVNLGRVEDAQALLDTFTDPETGDPHSDSALGFLAQIDRSRQLAARRDELEAKQKNGGIALDEALELLQLHRTLRTTDRYRILARMLAENPRLPKEYLVALAQMFAGDGQIDLLATALENYAAKDPDNVNIWYDLAAARAILGQPDVAANSLRRAIELGGEPVRSQIAQDTRFDGVRNYPAFRDVMSMPLPASAPKKVPKLPENLFPVPPATP
jgi:tetratricopeptide (TPR) repeat protein